MRAWWGRRSPRAQGMLVATALDVVLIAAMLVTGFPNNLGWPRDVLVAAGFGFLSVAVGRHVQSVAQAALDLKADRKAMRDAIDRLERGR